MEKCCGKWTNWIAFGVRQEPGPKFRVIDLRICEVCYKLSFEERKQVEDSYPLGAKFCLNRDTSLWPPRPRDKYDELADKMGISRLHAIHELDGA